MTESATNVIVGFRALHKFCENVAELLTKANELMKEGGWERISKWVSATEISANLDSPEYWLPHAFFCFYSHPIHEHLLSFVAVHVDDLWGDPPSNIDEPLISESARRLLMNGRRTIRSAVHIFGLRIGKTMAHCTLLMPARFGMKFQRAALR